MLFKELLITWMHEIKWKLSKLTSEYLDFQNKSSWKARENSVYSVRSSRLKASGETIISSKPYSE